MKVACPWCNEVKDVTGMLPDSVVQCTCGQTFRVPQPVNPPTAIPVEDPITPSSNSDDQFVKHPDAIVAEQATPAVSSAKPTPGMAIASLILGLISFITCGIFMAVPGLILGYSGRKQIDTNPAKFGGRGIAVAGIVINWISIIFNILVFLAIILIALFG